MTRRTLLQVALPLVTVAALLTACGTDSSDSAGKAPAKIRVGAQSAPGSGRANAEVAAAGDAKMAMMPLQKLVFVAGEGLASPGGSRRAWYFPANQDEVSQVTKDRLAAAFGLSGDWKTYPKDQGGASYLGDPAKGDASVGISPDAQLSWWYGAAWNTASMVGCAKPGIAVDTVTSEAASGSGSAGSSGGSEVATTVVEEPTPTVEVDMKPCEAPKPPANVPSKDEATAKAKDLLASLGMKVSDFEFEAYADEWSAYVTAWLLIDGQRAGVTQYVSFGAEGAVTGAGGFLASPVQGDEYELVSVDTAIKRLNDNNGWWGGYYPMARAVDAPMMRSAEIAASAPAAAATTETVAPGLAPEPVPAETLPVDNLPTDTVVVDTITTDAITTDTVVMPEPQEVTVTLTKVTVGFQTLWDADGNIWLLPSYTFTGTDGGQYTVFAVADEYLDFSAVNAVPMPAEASTGGEDVSVSAGSTDVTPPDAVEPATTEAMVSRN